MSDWRTICTTRDQRRAADARQERIIALGGIAFNPRRVDEIRARMLAAGKTIHQTSAWLNRGIAPDLSAVGHAMRDVYNRCSEGGNPPTYGWADGVWY